MSSTVVAPTKTSLQGPIAHHEEMPVASMQPNLPSSLPANIPPQVSSAGNETIIGDSAYSSSDYVESDTAFPRENSEYRNIPKVSVNSSSAQVAPPFPLDHSEKDSALASDLSSNEHSPENSSDASNSDLPEVTLHRRKPGPSPQIQVRPGVTVCQNCLTSTTPLWRRDENGQIMCNACGLFLKLHGRRRPISLKTDVIKSRNRSNRQNRPGSSNAPPSKRRQTPSSMAISSQNEASKPQPVQSAAQLSPGQIQSSRNQHLPPNHQQTQQSLHIPNRTGLPLGALPGIASMGAVPVIYPSSPALGPYLGTGAQGILVNSPALTPLGSVIPAHHLGHQPLSPQIIAQANNGPLPLSHKLGRGAMSEQLLPRSPESTDRIPHLAQVPVAQFQKSHDDIHEDYTKDKTASLMTRVSELELVNDLLRRRVQDLEASETDLRKQVDALRSALSKHDREQHSKRIKVDELL